LASTSLSINSRLWFGARLFKLLSGNGLAHSSIFFSLYLMSSSLLSLNLLCRSLLRMSAVISDTHCFVNIFGLGVAGRITAPGGTTNRMLLIEAYSVWNSTIYSLPLHIPQLKVTPFSPCCPVVSSIS
jgi:hypothetical protein